MSTEEIQPVTTTSGPAALESTAEEKLDFKRIAPILVIVLVDLLGLTIIIPLLPIYATTFGANAFVIGALGATYPLLQFVGAPILGQLSDKYGRRPILIISQIGTLVGFLVLGLANTLWLLFISRAIDGISGANIATAQAAITDNTSEKTRTQGLGLIGAAFGIGFIIGPLLAFMVLAFSNNNYPLVAFMAAIFSLLSIILSWFWLEESLPPEKRGQRSRHMVGIGTMFSALRKPAIGFLLALIFAQQFSFGGYEQFLPLFTLSRLGLNGSENAALFVFAGIVIVIVQGGLIGRWSRKFGERWLILMGLLVLGISLILSAVTPPQPVPWYSKASLTDNLAQRSEMGLLTEGATMRPIKIELPDDGNTGWLGLTWLMVALIPAAIGGGVLQPSINSLITKRVQGDEVGQMLGASTAFVSLANVVSPLVLGVIFQAFGSTAPFLIGGLLLLLLWGITLRRID